jgi:hypothetical protein
MEGLVILGGVLIRLGVPVALTLALVWLLRGLDVRWQHEALLARALKPRPARSQPPCWEIRQCSAERRAVCPVALAGPDGVFCWQQFRDPQGHLKEACLTCAVFRMAPAPAAA